MIGSRAIAAAALVLSLGLPRASSAERFGDESALDRLSLAVAEYPADPDLAWAYARNLASSGDIEEAGSEF